MENIILKRTEWKPSRMHPEYPESVYWSFDFIGEGVAPGNAVVHLAMKIIQEGYSVAKIGNIRAEDGQLAIDTGTCLLRIDVGGEIAGLLYTLEQAHFPQTSKIYWEEL